jgi:hypothetical protein
VSNREVRPPPEVLTPEEARERRVRMAFAFGSAMLLLSLPLCCCLGSALVNGTESGNPTSRHHHAP